MPFLWLCCQSEKAMLRRLAMTVLAIAAAQGVTAQQGPNPLSDERVREALQIALKGIQGARREGSTVRSGNTRRISDAADGSAPRDASRHGGPHDGDSGMHAGDARQASSATLLKARGN